jgi:hypothetical protein
VIASYDSVINHGTPQNLQANLKQSLSRFFGSGLTEPLAAQPLV